MKLLLDNNLSPRLVRRLGTLYPGTVHVRALNLQSASDEAIWREAAFAPVKGKWGASGSTTVTLKELSAAARPALLVALEAAWRRRAPKRLIAAYDGRSPHDV